MVIYIILVDFFLILMKLFKFFLGFLGLIIICNVVRNCNEENISLKIRNKIIDIFIYLVVCIKNFLYYNICCIVYIIMLRF